MRRESLPAQSLAQQYDAACRQTDALFACVLPEKLTARPVPERHRLLFYIGHLEAFDWNLLSGRLTDQPSLNPTLDRLFAFGIDPVGGGLPTDQPSDWPLLTEVYAYRNSIRERVREVLDCWELRPSEGEEDGGDDTNHQGHHRKMHDGNARDDGSTLIQVMIEHRQMHAETLAYLIHRMPHDAKRAPADYMDPLGRPADGHGMTPVPAGRLKADDARLRRSAMAADNAANGPAGLLGMTFVPPGTVGLGLSSATSATADDGATAVPFGWDNEFGDGDASVNAVSAETHEEVVCAPLPALRSSLPGYWIDCFMVTNEAFLAFVEAGGYDDARYWREEDFAWIRENRIRHPVFWTRSDSGWSWRGMFDEVPLPLQWPVYVSHAEASAYARFVGKRLPTEAEWQRAASGVPLEAGIPVVANANFARWEPDDVKADSSNTSRFGVAGQFGNGWEWTSSEFAPFPGFEAFPFYLGYSADFFDGRHFVMKGGSPRTATRMLRPTFRNWFQAHYPYAYVGFRCVSDASPVHGTGSVRDSDSEPVFATRGTHV